MNGKLVIAFMMLAGIILSACGSQPSAETATPTLVETSVIPVTGNTETQAAVTVEASVTPPAPTESAIATPEPPRPTNAPDCTNSASFVADVTIPDNTEIVGNSTFTKTWRIANTGTCIWGSDYTLTYYAGEQMGAPASVSLGTAYPGQNLDISAPFLAPNSLGSHAGYFVIRNPAGLIMKINSDSRLWVIIRVKNLAATATATVTASGTTNGTATSATGSPALVDATCAYSAEQARSTAVLDAVNAYRAQFGMPPYTVNAQLARAAQAHASDIACNNLFGHTGSNGSTIQSRVAAAGYKAAFVTENVYGSYPPLSPQEAVSWWINDKTDTHHRLNLVSDTFTEVGIGYAFFNNYGYYVIVFATP